MRFVLPQAVGVVMVAIAAVALIGSLVVLAGIESASPDAVASMIRFQAFSSALAAVMLAGFGFVLIVLVDIARSVASAPITVAPAGSLSVAPPPPEFVKRHSGVAIVRLASGDFEAGGQVYATVIAAERGIDARAKSGETLDPSD